MEASHAARLEKSRGITPKKNTTLDFDQEFKKLEQSCTKNTKFFKDCFENIKVSGEQTMAVNFVSIEEELNFLCELDIRKEKIEHNLNAASSNQDGLERKLKEVQENVGQLKDEIGDANRRVNDTEAKLKMLSEKLNRKEKVSIVSCENLQKDLTQLRNVLGLELATSTKGGTVVIFSNINDRSTKSSLHLGFTNNKYVVMDCDPPVPKLDKLVDILNQTNDLSGFVVNIRKQIEGNS